MDKIAKIQVVQNRNTHNIQPKVHRITSEMVDFLFNAFNSATENVGFNMNDTDVCFEPSANESKPLKIENFNNHSKLDFIHESNMQTHESVVASGVGSIEQIENMVGIDLSNSAVRTDEAGRIIHTRVESNNYDFEYCDNGNIVVTVRTNSRSSDITTLTYDSEGRLISSSTAVFSSASVDSTASENSESFDWNDPEANWVEYYQASHPDAADGEMLAAFKDESVKHTPKPEQPQPLTNINLHPHINSFLFIKPESEEEEVPIIGTETSWPDAFKPFEIFLKEVSLPILSKI